MRFVYSILVGICVMAAAAPAFSHEAIFGVDQRMSVRSNITRSSTVAITDGTYMISPLLRFKNLGEAFSYDLKYSPDYEVYFDTAGLNGWDQDLTRTANYSLSAKSSIGGTLRYLSRRAIRNDESTDGSNLTGVGFNDDGRVERILFDLRYNHNLTARFLSTTSAGYQIYNYTTSGSADSRGIVGQTALTYGISELTSVGANLVGSYRSFEQQGNQPGSTSSVINANLNYSGSLTPTISVKIQGGPSFLFSRQEENNVLYVPRFSLSANQQSARVFASCPVQTADGRIVLGSCPTVPVNSLIDDPAIFDMTPIPVPFRAGEEPETETNGDVTYFAEIEFKKNFELGYASIGYNRREDVSGGAGGTSVIDLVTMDFVWLPTDKWNVKGWVSWNRREQAANFTQRFIEGADSGIASVSTPTVNFAEATFLIPSQVDADSNIIQYRVGAKASRRLTDNLKLSGGYYYLYQENNRNDGFFESHYDNHVGSIMLEYQFDSIAF